MAEKHVFIQKDKDDIGNAHLKSLFHLYICLFISYIKISNTYYCISELLYIFQKGKLFH